MKADEILLSNTLSWEQKAGHLANLNGGLLKEVEDLRQHNTDLMRGFSNACVMRDHWKNKYEGLIKQN